MKKKKRVLLGMSGGVDSSVAALMLKKRGYDVIGITMQLLPKEDIQSSACCNLSAIHDAKRVCHSLNIVHYTLNIRENFKKKVIDYFVDGYTKGTTPNPCVECNRHIKFDELQTKAKELEVDFVATGHYCKKTYRPKHQIYSLKKAKDAHKDQTYFLYMLSSEQLKTTLFPLGNLLKSEVRQIAAAHGLINANKPESQEICFVPGSYKDFINKQLENNPLPKGEVVDVTGAVLGYHQGIHTVTIGQRKGLQISHPEPLYVLKIDPIYHRVTVGKKDDLTCTVIQLVQTTLVNPNETLLQRSFQMKIRYNMTPFMATVISQDPLRQCLTLELSTPQSFVTPGQSGVLYDKDRVVGGGIITLA